MNTALDRVIVAAVFLLIGGSVTLVQLNQNDVMRFLNIPSAQAPAIQETTQPETAKAAEASPAPTAPAAPAPVAAPAPAAPPAAPAVKTATTVSFVHMRTGKSTNTPIITNLDGGVVVELRSDSDRYWQGVTYQGKAGYIYKTYLQY